MSIRLAEKMRVVLKWKKDKLFCGKLELARVEDSGAFDAEYRLRRNVLLPYHTSNCDYLHYVGESIRIPVQPDSKEIVEELFRSPLGELQIEEGSSLQTDFVFEWVCGRLVCGSLQLLRIEQGEDDLVLVPLLFKDVFLKRLCEMLIEKESGKFRVPFQNNIHNFAEDRYSEILNELALEPVEII